MSNESAKIESQKMYNKSVTQQNKQKETDERNQKQ